ncbi:MexE family multidrug efflux RND transporter periplasmic adaptor subunit [Tateyamaria omphalii]|uniref:efflux RND transporter periplasmic adaptor subunit n=1 Tax=Tateyamaria omphalii TaxID=299262 RepID=UPI0016762B7A|nr:efflux RND transporter periplasmic adaptor subunit [Tateyamaria omphalii]GGX59189.1 MexE family multidrug efflux RND transporter periplasmic adaptor subunit [Tateyamaria omphalii]
MKTLASLSFILLLVFGTATTAQQGPPTVTAAKPVVKTIVEDDEFVGRFEARSEVSLRSRVSGYLEEVHFKEGTLVEAGQLLFTIDQRQFRTALRQAQARIDVAEATYEFATEQLERAQALIGNGNIPQSVLDERREAYLAAQGGLEEARAALELAELDLEFSEIRAPMSGRIDRSLIDPGNLVSADQTVLTSIVSNDPIYFVFDIDERYFLAYARDARARGTALQEGGGALEVKVTLSDTKIPPQTGYLDFSENRIDAETGTMRVRAVLENPDELLTPGLFGRVNVPGSLPYEGILIPDRAIVADQNRRLVMTLDADGVVTPLPIRPGPGLDGYRVVREGMDGTETIVIDGLVTARPGMTVIPEIIELPLIAEN